MQEKHTLGPWKVSSTNKGDEYSTVILGGEYNGIIARAELSPYWDNDQAEANARLIASAPELLEALKKYVDSMLPDYFIDKWFEAHKEDQQANRVLVNAIAVIKKAA